MQNDYLNENVLIKRSFEENANEVRTLIWVAQFGSYLPPFGMACKP